MVCFVEFILGFMSMIFFFRICVLIKVVGLLLFLYGSVINCVNNVF